VSRMTAEQVLTPLADLGYRFAVIDFAGGAIPFDADVARLAAYARAQSASHVDVKCDRA
jgi:hypothetical protein